MGCNLCRLNEEYYEITKHPIKGWWNITRFMLFLARTVPKCWCVGYYRIDIEQHFLQGKSNFRNCGNISIFCTVLVSFISRGINAKNWQILSKKKPYQDRRYFRCWVWCHSAYGQCIDHWRHLRWQSPMLLPLVLLLLVPSSTCTSRKIKKHSLKCIRNLGNCKRYLVLREQRVNYSDRVL